MHDFILVLRAVIKSPKGILLVQRNSWSPETWEFPGGKCDVGESLKNSLKREVKEETGLIGIAFSNMKIIEKTFKQAVSSKYIGQYIVSLYISGTKQKNYEVRLSREYQDYRWVADKYDIRDLNLDSVTREILEKIFSKK